MKRRHEDDPVKNLSYMILWKYTYGSAISIINIFYLLRMIKLKKVDNDLIKQSNIIINSKGKDPQSL